MKKRTLAAILLSTALLLSACGGGSSASSEAPAPGAAAEPDIGGSYYPDAAEYEDSAGGESYLVIDENTDRAVAEASTLTLSLKVDTAAYSNVTRYLESGSLPPKDAVRTEELINYFRYDEAVEMGGSPFGIYTEVAPSPMDNGKYIAMIRVRTPDLDKSQLPSSNLTFLIDTSGSMSSHDKLPLLRQSLGMLVETLDEDDTVSIVTYAGSSAVVLDSVNGGDKSRILDAINSLEAGGSTAGGEGIVTAYRLAEKNLLPAGNNRVILASDGDFNVGISSVEELKALIGEKRDSGVYLSVLGFGTGNIRDDIMETLAANGNGNYSYINSISTAQKVLVDELAANLFTVADDVKAQVEFNPQNVTGYRLIGYENRQMSNRDFDDDRKDAGEIGAGTDVVILFELELPGGTAEAAQKYAQSGAEDARRLDFADELFEVRIRYKDPGQDESRLVLRPVTFGDVRERGSSDLDFAGAVAAFGDLLRGSEYAEGYSARQILAIAEDSLGENRGGYRSEFLELVRQYSQVA